MTLIYRPLQTREMLWEGDVVDCYGRCVDFMRLYGIEIWMLDRQTPGLHCRLESPGKSNLASALLHGLIMSCRPVQLGDSPAHYSFPSPSDCFRGSA